jgi:hypothetical protein
VPNSYPIEDKIFTEKMLSYWFNFVLYEDPNYNNQGNLWQSFNKNLAKYNEVDKMKNGNYFLMQNNSFKMVNDFSSHHCNTWNYTQDSNDFYVSKSNIFQKILSKIKFSLASLF